MISSRCVPFPTHDQTSASLLQDARGDEIPDVEGARPEALADAQLAAAEDVAQHEAGPRLHGDHLVEPHGGGAPHLDETPLSGLESVLVLEEVVGQRLALIQLVEADPELEHGGGHLPEDQALPLLQA